MVRVEGGTFEMGTEIKWGRSDERPEHTVSVDSFYMSRYEVTQEEWYQVMGKTIQQQWKAAGLNGSPDKGVGDNYPVYCVNWGDALQYCNALSKKAGLEPAYIFKRGYTRLNLNANGYRLPTEAEWEFAARGGGLDDYLYPGGNIAGDAAWFADNSGGKAHPVGQKAPNRLGLYDMSGNVWEWVWDWYGKTYYSEGVRDNPTGPSHGTFRVNRGGNWSHSAQIIRSAYRSHDNPHSRFDGLGFRIVRR
jgi:formylglycine-generating enzyme required for sulfatase activity